MATVLRAKHIEEKYKLRLKRYERRNIEAQLSLLEERVEYVTAKEL